jgi:hypothetical protein
MNPFNRQADDSATDRDFRLILRVILAPAKGLIQWIPAVP